MYFEGHEFYKIGIQWVFDLTEFTGYKVTLNKKNKKVLQYTKAFKVNDNDKSCNFEYIKYVDNIPFGVFRKSEEIIKNYYKETSICE